MDEHYPMEAIAFAARQGSCWANDNQGTSGMVPLGSDPAPVVVDRFTGEHEEVARTSLSPQFRRLSSRERREGEDGSLSPVHRRSPTGGSGPSSKRQREGRPKLGKEEVVKRACEPCRRSKIKCSNEIPCAHCKSRGIEHSCVPCGNPGRVLLPREPLAVQQDGSFSQHQHGGADIDVMRHLPMSEMRWGSDQVKAWLQGLPVGVQNSLMHGLQVSKWQWGLNIPPDPQWAGPGMPMDGAGSRVGSADSDDAEGAAVNSMEHDLWSGHPSIGVFQADFHPKRGQVAVYANQRFASIFGLHRQEFLQQIMSQRLQMAIPHIDLAFLVFEDFEKPMASFSETAFRVLPHGKDQYVYVKAQKQRSFDRYGCLCRVTHFWEAISSAVYRSMRETSTEAKLGAAGRAKQARGSGGKQQSAVGLASATMTVQQMAMTGDDEDMAQVELLDQYARKVVGNMSRSTGPIAMPAQYPLQKKSKSLDVPRVTQPPICAAQLRTTSSPEALTHSLDMSSGGSWGIPEEELKPGGLAHFQRIQQFEHQHFRQQLAQHHALQQQQQQQHQQHHHQQHQHQHQQQNIQQHQHQHQHQQQQQQQKAVQQHHFIPVQQPVQQPQQHAMQQQFHQPLQPQQQQQAEQEQQVLGPLLMVPQAHPAEPVPIQQQQQQQHQPHLSMQEDVRAIVHDMWMTPGLIGSKDASHHPAQESHFDGVPVAALHQALAGLPQGDVNVAMADVRCING